MHLAPIYTAEARMIRQVPTRAERWLWTHLRNRRTAGAKFRRQVMVGGRLVSFHCPAHRITIIADGAEDYCLPGNYAGLMDLHLRLILVTERDLDRSPAAVLSRIRQAIWDSPWR
jgi:hypothetical protein